MAIKLVRSFQCIHDLIWKQRGFEVHIKNVKWHFFYGLLSLYVSVQTLKSNNQVLRSWRRSLQTLQTLQKSASKWSQRLSLARICFKHWKDFCDESLSILILKAQLLVSFSQIQQCVMFWVLFNSHKLWHLFVLEVMKERWNLNCWFEREAVVKLGGTTQMRKQELVRSWGHKAPMSHVKTKAPDSLLVIGTANDKYFFFVSLSVEIKMRKLFG